MNSLLKPPSHKEQVLEALRAAGSQGVDNFTLFRITPRAAARVNDLKRDGHNILGVHDPKRRNRYIYFLVTKPVQVPLFEVAA